jgi:hypothetical protein
MSHGSQNSKPVLSYTRMHSYLSTNGLRVYVFLID